MDNVLKLQKPMMHGSAVRRLQELGDLIGYDYGPNDGIYGKDTEAVVKAIQRDYGLKVDGICGPKTWKILIYLADKVAKTDTLSSGEKQIEDGIISIIGSHPRPKLYARQRTWKQVKGVTFHQTGCNMPSSPSGWSRLNAHVGITQEGKCIIANSLLDMIWHGQGLSGSTIGVEIEGNFYGIEGVESTLWKGGGGPSYLNHKMIDALNRLFYWLIKQFYENNADFKYIRAHRQSHSSRSGDPGSLIWAKICMNWIYKLNNLGYKVTDGGPYYSLGTGKPIPKEWNENYVRRYWKQ